MKVEETLPKRYGFAVIWFMFPIAVLKVTFHTNLREKNKTCVCTYVCMYVCTYVFMVSNDEIEWNSCSYCIVNVLIMVRFIYSHTYIHTYIYLDLDANLKSSVFGNKSLGTYIHSYIHTKHSAASSSQSYSPFCGVGPTPRDRYIAHSRHHRVSSSSHS